ncbi:uncharacterized protein LOC144650404 [Oculina patagonica]
MVSRPPGSSSFLDAMQKGTLVKRKHSPPKDASSSSSNEDEESKSSGSLRSKKNLSQGKKLKERNSPPTSENDDKIIVDGSSDSDCNAMKDTQDNTKAQADITKLDIKASCSKENVVPLMSKEQQEQDENIKKDEKTDKQLVTSIEDKMTISSTAKKDKPKRSMYLFDFLGDEVSNDESQALQALSSYWVNKVARNKDIMKRPPPKNQDEQDFYNKYCDKQGKLSITAATRLMSLPHVVTVCLKTTAQIEVVVSNRERALQDSEELRQNHFEVVEAMAMHLI